MIFESNIRIDIIFNAKADYVLSPIIFRPSMVLFSKFKRINVAN